MKSLFAAGMLAVLSMFCFSSISRAADVLAPQEQHRIEALIAAVEQATAVVFIRNGSSYDASSAATFLRLKWQFNAGKVHSAEEFIREIATRSGTSGLTYHVKLADGSQQESAEFLHGLLSGIPGT